eukprot:2679746-Rhodomonas_salina.1
MVQGKTAAHSRAAASAGPNRHCAQGQSLARHCEDKAKRQVPQSTGAGAVALALCAFAVCGQKLAVRLKGVGPGPLVDV